MKYLSSLLLIGALISSPLLLTGCEDDPLLAPQSRTPQDNGSYGNLVIDPPGDPERNDETVALRPANADNPEVF